MSELDKSQYCASCESFARQLAGLQALLKVKDEALSETSKEYRQGYLKGGSVRVSDMRTEALAQTSGTDALDKMLEAERVKVWNEFADMEATGYAREWEGDVSDLNNMLFEVDKAELDDNENWFALIPRPERKPRTHYAKDCLTKGE